jgi:regulator of replication initiation timing
MSRLSKGLKHPTVDDSAALDAVIGVVDFTSIVILVFVVFVGYRTIRAFKESKQAVRESASILDIIVGALTSRIEASESVVGDLRTDFRRVGQQTMELQDRQKSLRTGYEQLLGYIQEIMSNDRNLILELEQLKTRLTTVHENQTRPQGAQRLPHRTEVPQFTGDALATLTPTERHTLDILGREGPKAAPELGRRMRKSREHMARLMKKLYLDGYVDRESNHAPFRYKLNTKIASVLQTGLNPANAEASEKA